MALKRILVTGSNGQLGRELQEIAVRFPAYEFIFMGRQELSIEDGASINGVFSKWKPSYCINCAAYTAVDKAESDKEKAFLINSKAVGNLAKTAAIFQTRLIHISTDYVYDGNAVVPYKEEHPTSPVNIYGLTKLKGEAMCLLNNPDAIIIRTSWVYSEYGHNFVKTMLKLMKERPEVRVVSDQVGAPTYAADLAESMLKIITHPVWIPGIYHYTNAGRTSWYEFADAIRKQIKANCKVTPILTVQYPTPAKRPGFSLLDTEKITRTFGITIPKWEESLVKCLQKMGMIINN